jgi:hypothetical protein
MPALAECDPTAPFTEIRRIDELSTDEHEAGARLTSNERTLVFERDGDVYIAERSSATASFGEALPIDAVNESGVDGAPWIAANGLVLLFESDRMGGYAIFKSERQSSSADFEAPSLVYEGPTSAADPYLVGDENGTLYFSDLDNLFEAALDDWAVTGLVPLFETGEYRIRPVVTLDERTLYFAMSSSAVYVAQRDAVGVQFEEPDALAEVDAVGETEMPSWISPDRCRLYFDRGEDTRDLYVASRE